MDSLRSLRGEPGQVSVELVALVPLIVALAAMLWQAALAGQAIWLAGSAARAAARAEAVDGDAPAAARGVLPDGLERGMRVRRGGDGSVEVRLAVRSIFGGGRLATISSKARFEPQGRGEA
jgi:pilus assembly protein CpaE